MKHKKLLLFISLVAFCVLFTKFLGNKRNSYGTQSWKSASESSAYNIVAPLLIKNNIIGCSQMYISESNRNDEFLIACTNNDEDFQYYLVFANTGAVSAVNNEGINPPILK